MRGRVDLTKETHAQASSYAEPEHIEVHDRGSRLMELLQDQIVRSKPSSSIRFWGKQATSS